MANYIVFVLCLYILVASNIPLSPQRYFKFLGEFTIFLLEFFLICNSSELMDDCSGMVRDAVNTSNWINCSKQARRDLRMILRRVQVPNHLRFHQGTVVLNRLFFLKVFKVVYSFVNFMRVMSVQNDS
uniref:Uncharacterized protein n=1 Tax=Cacopsylla melanoneura TaxID=428564 RepID=A0A8D8X680_9HEMI